MKRRGRPKTDGVKPGWMAFRAFHALWAFEEARRLGAKYESALDQAVALVKADFPEMPMSISEVKRCLADLQPEVGEEVFLVSPIGERQWALRIGPRPVYPRKR